MLGRRMPTGERVLHRDFDDVAVLGVHLHQAAELRSCLHHPEDRLVVDLQDVLVSHEALE